MVMRRGKEFYTNKYEEAVKMHKSGTPVNDIAKKLCISYSAAYHWVQGLRKPGPGNVRSFESFLAKHGPTSVIDIKERFPKHNELFLTASRRGIPVKRRSVDRRYGEYATWYFLAGQERQLEECTSELAKKYKELKEKIIRAI